MPHRLSPCLTGLPALILLLAATAGFAQKNPQRILATFLHEGRPYNYEFEMKAEFNYSFKISSLGKDDPAKDDSLAVDSVQITASDNPPKKDPATENSTDPVYLFRSFDQISFVGIFLRQMKDKFGIDSTKALENTATEIFFTIKTRLNFIDDEPVTAYLILKKDNIHSFLQSNFSHYYNGWLKNLIAYHAIDRVTVETQDGAIKNITARMIDTALVNSIRESPRQYLEFKNPFPIGISGKFDPEKLSAIKLYCFNCYGIKDLSRYIHLSDLLTLDIVLENNKDDYSPSNRTIGLSPANPIQELKKDRRSRILNIAAFSDFVGMDQEQPNGLIQIEARRKININTKFRLLHSFDQGEDVASRYNLSKIIAIPVDTSYKTTRSKYLTYNLYRKRGRLDSTSVPFDSVRLKQRRFTSPYYTFFSTIEPVLLFSKLEQTNKLIDSGKVVNGKLPPILLYQYQLASLGVNLDILRVSFPQLKFNWNLLHGGYFWFRTRVATSSDTNSKSSVALNSNYWQLGTSFSFNPDTRWAASFGINYIHQQLLNPNYKIMATDGLWQIFFDGSFKTSDDNKMFLRFRWTSEVKDHDNNFTQIQLGYSMSLFVKPIETIH